MTAWAVTVYATRYADAQSSLGVYYANGEGVERDLVKAVEWYRLASEQVY